MGSHGTPSLMQVWGFFFLLLGPIKILGPFHRMTAEAEPALRRKLAFRGFIFATCIVLLAGTMGVEALHNYAVPPPVLALTGGLVLFLVALQGLLESFNPRPRPGSRRTLPPPPRHRPGGAAQPAGPGHAPGLSDHRDPVLHRRRHH